MSTSYPLDDDAKVSTLANRLRRQLLKGTVGTALVAALSYVGWTRWLFPPESPQPKSADGSAVSLGPVTDFAPGASPKQVTVTLAGTSNRVVYFVENLGAGGFRVLSAKCTHLGCNVEWQPGARQFLCPCHGAQYDVAGKVLSPPAPRPLPAAPTHVQGGTLYLTA